MSDRYLYISYSHHDKLIVDQFVTALSSRGLPVWQDISEIAPGDNWQEAIESGIKSASALLYFISANSTKSEWMQREIEAFIRRDLPIIPVMIDDVGLKGVPPALRSIQWLDLKTGIDHAADSIVKLLSEDIQIEAPFEKPEQKSKGYVFLNYAEEDFDFVIKLREFLKHRKYAYWDYVESKRDYHGQLFLELESAILDSTAVLSVLSEDWKRSKWTVREYVFSEEVRVPIFLLKAKPMGPTLAIAGTPYIDFISSSKRGFDELDRALDRRKL